MIVSHYWYSYNFFINIPQIVATWGWNYCITNLPWFRTFYNHGKVLGMLSLIIMAGSLINYIALLLVVTTVKYFTWFHVCITCVPVFILNFYMDGVFCYLFWCPMTSWNLSLSPNLGGLGLGFHNISTTGFITWPKRAPKNPKSTWRY